MRWRAGARWRIQQQLAHGTVGLDVAQNLGGSRVDGHGSGPDRNHGQDRGDADCRECADPTPRDCSIRRNPLSGSAIKSLPHALIESFGRRSKPGCPQWFFGIVHRFSSATMVLSLARPRRYHDVAVDSGTRRRSATSWKENESNILRTIVSRSSCESLSSHWLSSSTESGTFEPASWAPNSVVSSNIESPRVLALRRVSSAAFRTHMKI